MSDPVPQASFLNFLSGLAAQALMQLGEMANPLTGEKAVNLPYAQYSLQLLEVLERKTAGNRTAEEDTYLKAVLTDLRGRLARAQGR